MGAQVSIDPHAGFLASKAISFSSAGDNTVIAALAPELIRIFKIWFVAAAATSVTFKSGSGTNLSGAFPLATDGALVFDFDGEPWMTTNKGDPFVINSTNAVLIAGMAYYSQTHP